MDILMTNRLHIAICKALDVDYEKHPVSDVSVDMKRKEAAKVNVTFYLDRETLSKVADIINDKKYAETQS